jgi:hypothetical protein
MIIDWSYFLDDNMPNDRNMPPQRQFMLSCFKVLSDINVDAQYRLGHTFQKASLENLLNGKYALPYSLDMRASLIAAGQIIWLERRIQNDILTFIFKKTEAQPETYIYGSGEGQPPLYVYSSNEVVGTHDFIVWIPSAVTYNENQLRALIYQYVDCTARFLIQTY